MDPMDPLDPYGYGRSTPLKALDDKDANRVTTPGHAEEIALAKQTSDAEPETPSADVVADTLDLGLLLEEAPSAWFRHRDASAEATDIPAEHPDEAAREPDQEPYAPLIDSGGQGI